LAWIFIKKCLFGSLVNQFEVFFNIAIEYFVVDAFSIGVNSIFDFGFGFILFFLLDLLYVLRLGDPELVLQFDDSLRFLNAFISIEIRR